LFKNKKIRLSKSRNQLSRRTFSKILIYLGATFATPALNANLGPKIIIVGGGIGGMNVLRVLTQELPMAQFFLIEPNSLYVTSFFTNQYIANLKKLSNFTHSYTSIKKMASIKLIHEWVSSINPEKQRIRLNSGQELSYDALVLSPGIDLNFRSIDGYDEECLHLFPHAYSGSNSSQWKILHQQITNMPNGGLLAISVPRRPYRCTPAPYERAALIANYFKLFKPKSKILILDSKNEFPLMSMTLNYWSERYGDLLEWVSADFGGSIHSLDKKSKTLISNDEKFVPDVANIIPSQTASRITLDAALTNKKGWCPINGITFESKLIPNIYLLGDTIDGGDMPKSASAALSQANIVAQSLQLKFAGLQDTTHKLKNDCFFFTSPEHAAVTGGEYRIQNEKIIGFKGYSSAPDDDDQVLYKNGKNAMIWYKNIIKQTFLWS